MLRQLDVLIRDLLIDQIVALAADAQVRFQPPDATLRTDVVNLNQIALNVYLADLREHRKLRTNERERVFENGTAFSQRFPDRLDCHYLISAWSPTQPAAGVEPTLDEHALLYETAAVLMTNSPLNPARLYALNPARLATWPARFQRDDFPATVVPPEGFGKLSEFWTTMGSDMRWRPVVYYVVTLPVALVREMEGPMVTTVFGDYRQRNVAASAEVWLNLGGHVRRQLGAGVLQPIEGAWVRLETLAGTPVQLTRTDDRGRFVFERLRASQYRLVARATGFAADQIRPVDVPSETGEYDLTFP